MQYLVGAYATPPLHEELSFHNSTYSYYEMDSGVVFFAMWYHLK